MRWLSGTIRAFVDLTGSISHTLTISKLATCVKRVFSDISLICLKTKRTLVKWIGCSSLIRHNKLSYPNVKIVSNFQNWKIGQSRLSLNEAFLYETAPPPFVPVPPPNPKQLKKWQKKHKKLLKKMASMPPPLLTHGPPPVPPYTRAFSVDNLNR